MKRIKLYTSLSLDGFIARPDGKLDWLENFENASGTDYGYEQFLSGIDTLIMGRKTYDAIISYGIKWPYEHCITFIVTKNPEYQVKTENTFVLSGNVIEQITMMKSGEGKDIWLVGGGKINSYLLNYALIDDMILSVVPVIIGEGLPLFPDKPTESLFKFVESIDYEPGIVNLIYSKID